MRRLPNVHLVAPVSIAELGLKNMECHTGIGEFLHVSEFDVNGDWAGVYRKLYCVYWRNLEVKKKGTICCLCWMPGVLSMNRIQGGRRGAIIIFDRKALKWDSYDTNWYPYALLRLESRKTWRASMNKYGTH